MGGEARSEMVGALLVHHILIPGMYSVPYSTLN